MARRLRRLSAPQGRSSWRPRRGTMRCSTRSWRRKRPGSARASRRGAPATKAGCGRCRRCARSAAQRRERSGKAELAAGRRRAVRQAGVRGRGRLLQLRRDRVIDQRFLDHHPARRPGRHHRAQRRRQVHPDQAAARRTAAGQRARCDAAPACRSPISTSSATSSTPTSHVHGQRRRGQPACRRSTAATGM